jgi:hypothetical protein
LTSLLSKLLIEKAKFMLYSLIKTTENIKMKFNIN